MAQAAVRPNRNQSAYVLRHLAAQVALDQIAVLKNLDDGRHVCLAQIARFGRRIDPRLLAYLSRPRPTDSVDSRQRYVCALVRWDVNTENSRHSRLAFLDAAGRSGR